MVSLQYQAFFPQKDRFKPDAKMLSQKEEHHGAACSGEDNNCLSFTI
jgi:hypothetical protein